MGAMNRLGLLLIFAGAALAADLPDDTPNAAVAAFAQAGDRRDVQAMEALLHPEFRVVFAMLGTGGVKLMTRAAYLAALRAGQIGGDMRQVQITAMESLDQVATVRARLRSEKATFDSVFTLVRDGGRWRIIQDTTLLTPPAAKIPKK